MMWFIGIASLLTTAGCTYKAVTAPTAEQSAMWTQAASTTFGVTIMAGVTLVRTASHDRLSA